MKKQSKSKRFPLWGFKGLLSVALSGLAVVVFAQAAEVCQDSGYTIADAVPASAGSEYRWLENGNVLANTNQAAYNVPANKAAGVYTYVRQSKSAACPDWQSSNEFTVTVFSCTFTPPSTVTGTTATFTDPRDGKKYKTVVMPDGKIWFAQNLNYTQGLTYNAYSSEANGKPFTSLENGAPAIGSYWCPGVSVSTYSGDQNTCNIYGALYTWETAMMVDGKYADETKTSSAWDEKWVSANYFLSGTYAISPNAEKNNARGATNVHGGGRGICPLGWHVPTILEYAKMLDAVSESSSYTLSTPLSRTGIDDVARKLKIATLPPDKLAWSDAKTYPNHDTYGFSLAAAGERNPWYGDMRGLAMYTWVVSSTVQSSNDCHNMNSVYYTYQNGRYGVTIYTHLRSGSYSIRCIKD